MMRLKLIPPASPFAPIVPYDDDGGFAEQLDQVHRAAAALVGDPLVDIAVAVQALPYKQKSELAAGLRTSVMRLNTWAALMLEVRS